MRNNSFFRIALLVALLLIAGSAFLLLQRMHQADQLPKQSRVAVAALFAGNETRILPLHVEGTVMAQKVVNVAFEVGGKLEPGEIPLEPGATFKKGQLLFQIDNREAFAALNREKTALSALVLQTLPAIEQQFPAEKNKWLLFMEELKPQYLLPPLPRFNSSAERYLITDRGILTAFYAIQQSEVRMTNYFFLAPFDGILEEVAEQPGNTIRSGQRVARIIAKGDYRVQIPVPYAHLEAFRKETRLPLCLANGDTIGTLRQLSRTGIMDTQSQTMDHFYSIRLAQKKHLFHGMPVRAALRAPSTTKSCRLPETALNNDEVQLIRNGKLITQRVNVILREKDTVFVEGLQDGDAVAQQFIDQVDPKAFYFPKR